MQSRLFVVIVVCTIIAACGLAEDFGDAMDARDAVQSELLDDYGLKSQIGFNITNGRLMEVSITVMSEEVRGMAVDDLIDQIEAAVKRHFDQSPKTLTVSISVTT